MTINNLHQRIGTTAVKSKDSSDDGRLGLFPSLTSKVLPAKDFEGVIKSDGKFLEEITYKQLETMHTIVANYKEVVKSMLLEPGFKT